MIFLALLLLTADPRQVIYDEEAMLVCRESEVASLCVSQSPEAPCDVGPGDSLCWAHRLHRYEWNGVEWGVDFYRVYEDDRLVADLPCGLYQTYTHDGMLVQLWRCTASVPFLRHAYYFPQPGEVHEWCVEYGTYDFAELFVSDQACTTIRWKDFEMWEWSPTVPP